MHVSSKQRNLNETNMQRNLNDVIDWLVSLETSIQWCKDKQENI